MTLVLCMISRLWYCLWNCADVHRRSWKSDLYRQRVGWGWGLLVALCGKVVVGCPETPTLA